MTNCTPRIVSISSPKKHALLKPISRVATLPQTAVCCCCSRLDRRLGLSEAVARTLDDPRRQASIDHNSLSLLRQRVYALALGYEDLNDHETLRLDLAIQTALGAHPRNWPAVRPCAAGRTGPTGKLPGRMHEVIVEQFIASF